MNTVPKRSSPHQRISPAWFLISLALVLTLLAGCMPIQPPATNLAASKAITLRFAIADQDKRPSAPYIREFAAQVKTLSQGSITIELVWDAGGGTFYGFERGVLQRVLTGQFDLGLASSRTWDTESMTNFQALQAPFLITNDALSEAIASSDIAKRMLDSLAPTGLVGLTLWPEDLRHPFSVVPDKSLLAPQDFAGLNVRASASDVTYQIIGALGANPMFEDTNYQGAESGLRQGSSLTGKPIATGNVTFFPKFQVLFANGAVFARLSMEQRDVLRQAAAAAQKKAIAEHPREVVAATAWCADGGTIVLASAAQVAAFEQAAQPIFDQLAKDPGNATLIAAIRTLKVSTAPSPGAAACAPVATQLGAAPKADAQVWSKGLPPNGVWQAKLTTEDFVRMGELQSVALEWAGTYTLTFQDGKFQMLGQDEQGNTGPPCVETYAVVGDFVRFTSVDSVVACPNEVDDIQWRIDPDGLHLHLVAIQNAKFLEGKAWLEAKPWQKVK